MKLGSRHVIPVILQGIGRQRQKSPRSPIGQLVWQMYKVESEEQWSRLSSDLLPHTQRHPNMLSDILYISSMFLSMFILCLFCMTFFFLFGILIEPKALHRLDKAYH